jgi:acetyl-CoA synthetase
MEEPIPPDGQGNLVDYDRAYREFAWASMDDEFEWSRGGMYNVAAEAVDRHARSWRKNKVALFSITAGDEVRKYTFGEMAELTNRFASGLKELGAVKGDRVFVFLDRTSELYMSIVGIAKMGGIAGPLFSALGPEAFKDRALDCDAKIVITSPYLYKRLEPVMDELVSVEKFIIVGGDVDGDKVIGFDEVMESGDPSYRAVDMTPTDPYIIHYTSGSTGKPKGVLLGHRAMVQQLMACRYVVDLREEDTYWCTADPGWVTGTSVGIFGPWYLGTTLVSYEGRFNARSWYGIIERFKVTVWFTAPTALRMLMRAGDDTAGEFNLTTLRHVCSAGEPLNPEVIRWGTRVLGRRIHDNWWQTETGAPCISNYRCMEVRPGSMGKPIPGMVAAIVDDGGAEVPTGQEGFLALRPGWPSMMVGIWRNTSRFREYFDVPGWYISGHQAYKDADGYVWFLGRVDDVIKTSGERLGPFEVESALIEHHAVAESGVIGKPDELRGEIVKAFIILRPGFAPSERLKEDITQFVKTRLAYYAYPREIEFVETLPKTRSGKIMRRVLKARETGQPIGDLSMMED